MTFSSGPKLRACLLLGMFWSCHSCKSADGGPAKQAPTAFTGASASAASPLGTASPARTTPAPASAETAPPAKPRAREREPYRIAVVGDSLADPKSHGGAFLQETRVRCPETRIDNFARGGHMLNQIRRVFEDSVHNQPHGSYTHVVVWGGVNDLYSDLTALRTPEKAESDLSVIYEKARNKGAKVVALTVSPWGGFKRYHNERRQKYTEALNDWIRRQLQEGKLDYVVDSYALLSCGAPELLCPEYQQRSADGLHLGKRGHEVLGLALFQQVFESCR